MIFRVGQRVECIDTSGWDTLSWYLPTKGCIYSIREIFLIDDFEFVRLMEIRNKSMFDFITEKIFEPRFLAIRFRPIVESETEVSFTTGADPSSDQFDNRRKVRKKVTT